MKSTDSSPVIRKLEEDVVNRIAAGEVIHRPSSAIKELIENSLDAKATRISVILKDGGMKLLQVQDNGTGIRAEDFPILCQRFTTSKLTAYEDLKQIATFGFRGEALASITMVAHVQITSMPPQQNCAYRGYFSDGVLVPPVPGGSSEPQPCAGIPGTTIQAEDLFYNVPIRKAAIRSHSEEYGRCLHVLTCYAIHYAHVAFICKKHGSSKGELHTTGGPCSRLSVIKHVYGSSMSRELLPLRGSSEKYEVKFDGLVSNANFNSKKFRFILFINNRMVDGTSIKRAIAGVYQTYLPRHTHPFVYLGLEIKPQNIDVNVHPTKREVEFLHIDEITEVITSALEKVLTGANTSRVFRTQTLSQTASPFAACSASGLSSGGSLSSSESSGNSKQYSDKDRPEHQGQQGSDVYGSGNSGGEKENYEKEEKDKKVLERKTKAKKAYRQEDHGQLLRNKSDFKPETLVRTDAGNPQGRLDMYFKKVASASCAKVGLLGQSSQDGPEEHDSTADDGHVGGEGSSAAAVPSSPRPAKRRRVQLTSVLQLREEVRSDSHKELSSLFQKHSFVGCVNLRFALVQYRTKLVLVDLPRVSENFFYQRVLDRFENFAQIKLHNPLSVYALLQVALQKQPWPEWVRRHKSNASKKVGKQDIDETIQAGMQRLEEKAAMLNEYFAITFNHVRRKEAKQSHEVGQHKEDEGEAEVEDGETELTLVGLPYLLRDYHPPTALLPLFLLGLAFRVDWTAEKPCFQTVAQELARFYKVNQDASVYLTLSEDEVKRVLQHHFFPALMREPGFFAPKTLAEGHAITQVASLENLYKTFERC